MSSPHYLELSVNLISDHFQFVAVTISLLLFVKVGRSRNDVSFEEGSAGSSGDDSISSRLKKTLKFGKKKAQDIVDLCKSLIDTSTMKLPYSMIPFRHEGSQFILVSVHGLSGTEDHQYDAEIDKDGKAIKITTFVFAADDPDTSQNSQNRHLRRSAPTLTFAFAADDPDTSQNSENSHLRRSAPPLTFLITAFDPDTYVQMAK